MSILTVTDTLRQLLDPDPRHQDRSGDRPPSADITAERWYLWPASEAFADDGQGQLDREEWQLGVIWAANRGAEVGGVPSRDVTELIVAKAEHLRAVLAANRSAADASGTVVWEWAELAQVDYERLRTNTVRGFLGRIDGWVYRT